uniref:Uncharacterized protein n=1 Tax=Neobodo designis TaxID=312471 RepID=A0A7S1QPL3_NEODS|mmetsp:Transcript_49720/g.153647  ORF Transcript_49720/g.153647 Transcript_49720/m.153647 type:complete len:666 (+) Transcript_49720:336-2333(+)|eukprot:CAMPEP_0174840802 /NCGR_PEP_ID=MMETSP1114-20130205/8909_1 /TAXON_ID=312471 /ORGANISM="Neobodo designis, Strain CCAP 1951/1" /LENGTH=665 /DNA_ID=CAMNT_0016074969 /DNA_START=334 /DNA_END=2331 /DNA_ORIENTATION=+
MGCCTSKEHDHESTAAGDATSGIHSMSKYSAKRKSRYASAGDDDGSTDGECSPRERLEALRELQPPQGDPSGIELTSPNEGELSALRSSFRRFHLAQQSSLQIQQSSTSAPGTNDDQSLATPAGSSMFFPAPPGHPGAAGLDGSPPQFGTPERPPALAVGTPQGVAVAPGAGDAVPTPGAATISALSPKAKMVRLKERVRRWMSHHVFPPPRPIYAETGPLADVPYVACDGESSSNVSSCNGGHVANNSQSPRSGCELPVPTGPPSSDAGLVEDPDAIDDLPLGATACDFETPIPPPLAQSPMSHHHNTPVAALPPGYVGNRRSSAGGTITFVTNGANHESFTSTTTAVRQAHMSTGVTAPAPAAFPSAALLRVSSMGRRRATSFNTQVSSSDGGNGTSTGRIYAASSSNDSAGPGASPHALITCNTGSGEFTAAPNEQAPAVLVSGMDGDGSPHNSSVSPKQTTPGAGNMLSPAGTAPAQTLGASPNTTQQSLTPAGGLTLPAFSRRPSRLAEQNVADVPEQDDMLDYFAPTPLANANNNAARPRSAMGASAISHPGTLPAASTSMSSHPGSRRDSAACPNANASVRRDSGVLPTSPGLPQGASTTERPAMAASGSFTGPPPAARARRSGSEQSQPASVEEVVIPGYVWSMQADGELVNPSDDR